MKKIAFIGVGVMGRYMVANLLKSGYEVDIFARDKSKVEDTIKQGARFHNSIKECVKNSDVVITMLGFPKDVSEVYFSKDGLLDSAKSGAYLIDMTTTTPALSKKIYQVAKSKGLKALDAPVTGGDIGAKNATLSIMVGGEKDDFHSCEDIFKVLGKTIVYMGEAGNAQHAKMANQIAIAGIMAGISEALTYAKNKNLDIKALLSAIQNGAAQSFHLTNTAPRMLKGDLKAGFYIKHMVKDLQIALDEEPNLVVLKDVLNIYKSLEDDGFGELGTQAICKFYEKE